MSGRRNIDAASQVAGSRAVSATVREGELAEHLPPSPAGLPPLPLHPSERSLRWDPGVHGGASVSALTRSQSLTHLALGLLWLLINVQFWSWWIERAQGGEPWLALTVSVALAYQVTVLPTIFWWYLGRMRRPVHRSPQNGLRVAMVTLCVPSYECLEMVARQLEALRDVRYPHESWILDEEDSPVVRELARIYGVHHFTRKGIERWNQPGPPFQRKTKAGNVNAWLASRAERKHYYDVFVQLDIDHRPDSGYLDRVLGHFDDPTVGWVQAPSICGNLDYWAARGQAEQDLVLQGPLQMGFYGSSRTPFIIGSHTSYRTSAVFEIGGFQPTRAEDHLDTVVLAANGYRGVYVPDPIAVGDGPEDFATYLRQQFAWAYSMITVLFSWTPRLIRRYSVRQGVQFLFSQTWYPLWSISTLALWAAPLVALISNERIADARLIEYLVYFTPLALGGWLLWCFARPWFKPSGLRISWRSAALTVARWPVVLWALLAVLLRIKRPYMITPKGTPTPSAGRTLLAHGPLLTLATVALGCVWITGALGDVGEGRSYLLLVLINALIVVLASGFILLNEQRALLASPVSPANALRGQVAALAWFAALVAMLATTAVVFWDLVRVAVS